MAPVDGQAVPCSIPDTARHLVGPESFDYIDAFAVSMPSGEGSSAESWARVMFTPSGGTMHIFAALWGAVTGRIVVENSYLTVTNGLAKVGDSEIRADGLFSLGYPRDDGGEEMDARIRVARHDIDSLRHAFGIDDGPAQGTHDQLARLVSHGPLLGSKFDLCQPEHRPARGASQKRLYYPRPVIRCKSRKKLSARTPSSLSSHHTDILRVQPTVRGKPQGSVLWPLTRRKYESPSYVDPAAAGRSGGRNDGWRRQAAPGRISAS